MLLSILLNFVSQFRMRWLLFDFCKLKRKIIWTLDVQKQFRSQEHTVYMVSNFLFCVHFWMFGDAVRLPFLVFFCQLPFQEAS